MSLVTSVQANVYLGVSTMYLRELRENQDGEWDLSCLRAGLVAGATSPLAVFEEYEKRYGAILVNSYGMTETAATLTVAELDDPLRKRAASVGHPIEGAEVRTAPLDADGDGLACPYPAEPEGGWRRGELVCKTPSLADGIIGADGELVQRLDAEGWLHTGDIGWVDADNYVWVDGRVKDMIIRGGINIYPAEVENTYQDHPQVAECCLVGYPDPDLGERTCLCVIMNEDADLSMFAMREYAKGRIEKCKIPDLVMRMDEFPRLGNGRIDKKALQAHVKGILCPCVGGGCRHHDRNRVDAGARRRRCAAVDEFCDAYFTEDAIKRVGANPAALPTTVYDAFYESPLGKYCLPEYLGGRECSLGEKSAVIARLCHRAGAMLPFVNDMLSMTLLDSMREMSRREVVQELLAESGHVRFSEAFSEARAGSDASAVQTTVSVEGDGVFLDGEKSFVSGGQFWPEALVLARDPVYGREDGGLSLSASSPSTRPACSPSRSRRWARPCSRPPR